MADRPKGPSTSKQVRGGVSSWLQPGGTARGGGPGTGVGSLGTGGGQTGGASSGNKRSGGR